ncbi:hypothetical protein LMH87_001475 [Akanthomyces muscarius]|uniref:JmjC domain-containing protein n=1 Tax=Akanthomyces muscarius TaxID=2231603 RepID=A0A9W8UHL0_AKAMU|nr:hypothetical protein LMH87_001475 [Akanthomyces muscarius]KAJ4146920.1 hypothetical protein LMH87_001475 [Akanthomyces muscarius]
MAGNRKARAKAVGLMWRLFLDNIGLPFNFLLVVPEVTPQDDGWSCGYITIVNALLMIRGCVGQSLRDMTETCRLDEIPVDGCTVNRPHDYFSLEKSDILYLDWCGIAETRSKAVNFMLSALKHMAANELGFIRGMLRVDDGPGTPAVDLRPYSSRAKIPALQPGLSAIGGPIPFKIELSVREYAERIFDNPPSTECWPTAAQMPLLGELARPLPRDLPARRFEITALPRHVESGYPGPSSPFEPPSVVSLGKTKRMSESLHEIDSRTEVNDRIFRKLKQCYSIPADDPKSLWHRKMEALKKMLPENKDIPFACIGYNNERQRDLTDRLRDVVAPGSRVQVGDPRSHERLPRPVAVEDVISAIEGKTSPPLPDFLQCRRFEVIQLLGSRLRTEFAGAGKPRTTITIQGRALDLSSSLASTLFVQDGAFTGMHRDVLPSWILNYGSEAVGSKVVFFPAPGANMLEFEEQGEDWAPEVRVVILEAGDYLIMPTPVPHAVLTMGDTWMCSGMFIDLYNILSWLDSLIYTAKNGNTTNEPIPLELISGWHHLEALFMEHIRRSRPEEESDQIAAFMEREQVLRGLLSCSCKGKCADRYVCSDALPKWSAVRASSHGAAVMALHCKIATDTASWSTSATYLVVSQGNARRHLWQVSDGD